MTDLKLYQIPRSVLAKEPKPLMEIDVLEALAEQGFDRGTLESKELLPIIGAIAALMATRLGYTAKANYGVVSMFDAEAFAEYERLVENYRMRVGMDPDEEEDEEPAPTAKGKKALEAVKAGKKKKKKKK